MNEMIEAILTLSVLTIVGLGFAILWLDGQENKRK